VSTLIETNGNKTFIKKALAQLDEAMSEVEKSHKKYVLSLDQENEYVNDEWLIEVQESVDIVKCAAAVYIDNTSSEKASNETMKALSESKDKVGNLNAPLRCSSPKPNNPKEEKYVNTKCKWKMVEKCFYNRIIRQLEHPHEARLTRR